MPLIIVVHHTRHHDYSAFSFHLFHSCWFASIPGNQQTISAFPFDHLLSSILSLAINQYHRSLSYNALYRSVLRHARCSLLLLLVRSSSWDSFLWPYPGTKPVIVLPHVLHRFFLRRNNRQEPGSARLNITTAGILCPYNLLLQDLFHHLF